MFGHHLFVVGTGSTTSGTLSGGTIKTGSYAASIAATGTATTNEHGSCAPASGTVTLADTASGGGTISETVTGKLCTATSTDAHAKSAFLGKFTVGSASGNESALNGATGFVALVEKQDGTARLFEFSRRNGLLGAQHTVLRSAKSDDDGDSHSGCDHRH